MYKSYSHQIHNKTQDILANKWKVKSVHNIYLVLTKDILHNIGCLQLDKMVLRLGILSMLASINKMLALCR